MAAGNLNLYEIGGCYAPGYRGIFTLVRATSHNEAIAKARAIKDSENWLHFCSVCVDRNIPQTDKYEFHTMWEFENEPS